MAVITAFEFHRQLPAGKSARQPDGAHARFRSRTDQPHHLDRRYGIDDQFRKLHLAGRWRSKTSAQFKHGSNGIDHRLRTVPEEQRTPGAHIVDVCVAIYIEDVRAVGSGNESRRAADGSKGPDWRIHTARNALFRTRE